MENILEPDLELSLDSDGINCILDLLEKQDSNQIMNPLMDSTSIQSHQNQQMQWQEQQMQQLQYQQSQPQHVVTGQQQDSIQQQQLQQQWRHPPLQQFNQQQQLQRQKQEEQSNLEIIQQKQVQQNIPRTINQPIRKKIYLELAEQVSTEKLRFRYVSEGRSVFIAGINSTPEKKTYPGIRIMGGYKGKCTVVVSCVTEDYPYRTHPHELTDKDNKFCKDGVCTKQVDEETMTVYFQIGVQCVTIQQVKSSLEKREKANVDPYGLGFKHKREPKKINLGAVRLCFQAFIPLGPKKWDKLDPIVSNPIYDLKSHTDLQICKISHYSGTCSGGTEMILLCEKVVKNDILVIFYEEINGEVTWEAKAIFFPNHVHRQSAICFKTPPYKNQDIDEPVQVLVQLKRPSDGAISESRSFQYLPVGTGESDMLKRKRRKYSNNPMSYLMEQLNSHVKKTNTESLNPSNFSAYTFSNNEPNDVNVLYEKYLPASLNQAANLNSIPRQMNVTRASQLTTEPLNNPLTNSEQEIRNIAKNLEQEFIPTSIVTLDNYLPKNLEQESIPTSIAISDNFFVNNDQAEKTNFEVANNFDPLLIPTNDAEIPTIVGCISAEMPETVIPTDDDFNFDNFANKLSLSDLVREAVAGEEEMEAEVEEINNPI